MEGCVERVKYLKSRHKIDLRAFEETESDSLSKLKKRVHYEIIRITEDRKGIE